MERSKRSTAGARLAHLLAEEAAPADEEAEQPAQQQVLPAEQQLVQQLAQQAAAEMQAATSVAAVPGSAAAMAGGSGEYSVRDESLLLELAAAAAAATANLEGAHGAWAMGQEAECRTMQRAAATTCTCAHTVPCYLPARAAEEAAEEAAAAAPSGSHNADDPGALCGAAEPTSTALHLNWGLCTAKFVHLMPTTCSSLPPAELGTGHAAIRAAAQRGKQKNQQRIANAHRGRKGEPKVFAKGDAVLAMLPSGGRVGRRAAEVQRVPAIVVDITNAGKLLKYRLWVTSYGDGGTSGVMADTLAGSKLMRAPKATAAALHRKYAGVSLEQEPRLPMNAAAAAKKLSNIGGGGAGGGDGCGCRKGCGPKCACRQAGHTCDRHACRCRCKDGANCGNYNEGDLSD